MPNLRFAAAKEERVALITGGAHGIGRATALRLAEEGRRIVIADLPGMDEVKVDGVRTQGSVVEEIQALGQQALYIPTDVTDESAVQATVAQAVETFGRLDILVCCAGTLGVEAPFLEQPVTQFEKVMRINVVGVYHAHQAAIPHMLKGGWGRCVTITSGARNGSMNQVPYSVSKGAVYSFVGALGNAYSKDGVFVNGVEPGRALTNMVVPRFSEEFLSDPGHPLGRYSDPEEVAEVIEFLCSERNTYTSGSVWSVKGATG